MCDGSVSASVFFWHLCKLENKISRVPSADRTGPVPADPQAGVRALDLALLRARDPCQRIRKQAYEHLIFFLRARDPCQRIFLRNGP